MPTVSLQMISSFACLRKYAAQGGSRRVAIVVAEDEIALTAARDALQLGIASPVLIGDPEKIRDVARSIGFNLAGVTLLEALSADAAAQIATNMASRGEVDILLKGHLRTDQLLHAVLDKSAGLRTGRLLSDVLLYEDTLAGSRRLVAITDGGLNVAPTTWACVESLAKLRSSGRSRSITRCCVRPRKPRKSPRLSREPRIAWSLRTSSLEIFSARP